jgi:hypothetical protein
MYNLLPEGQGLENVGENQTKIEFVLYVALNKS